MPPSPPVCLLPLAFSLIGLIGVSATAQPSPCDTPAHAALDFWLGIWDLTWPGGQGGTPEGAEGRGTNTLTKTLDGCVVHERFAAEDGFAGESVSVYDPRNGTWRQTWVDNRGGYLLFTGGVNGEGEMELRTAPFTNPHGQEQVNRMIWSDVMNDALTWRWQRSTDGGATWEDLWVIHYTRR